MAHASSPRAGAIRQPLLAYNADHDRHDGRMNENAGRVRAAHDELRRSGLWARCELLLQAPSAAVYAETLHSARHLAMLRTAFLESRGWFCAVCTLENAADAAECMACCTARGRDEGCSFCIPEGKTSVHLCAASLDVALTNCALCAEAARRGCATRTPAFALVRPPGHHASSESFGSYCLLNTVGITARALLQPSPSAAGAALAQRILIIDWDIHHGDGTQALVLGDGALREACTFVPIHRHDEGFWPKSGGVGEGSGGAAGGRVVNVPLRGTGYGDADYYRVFERLVVPLAARLQPDAVLVSAGYDCAAGDLLGRFQVSSTGFCHLSRLVLGLAGGAALFVLEGGYDVDGSSGHAPLVAGVCASVDGMLQGAMGIEDLPSGWRREVKPQTDAVLDEVEAVLFLMT